MANPMHNFRNMLCFYSHTYLVACQGLVTLRITVSPALIAVPGAGSMATTVQLAGTKTFWYFSVAETSSTSVKPRALSLFSAIFAFSPVRSGIVIGADATGVVVSGELVTEDGSLELHDGELDWDCVTVTVEGGLDVLPPQAAIVSATANVPVAIAAVFRFTVAERITVHCSDDPDSKNCESPICVPPHGFQLLLAEFRKSEDYIGNAQAPSGCFATSAWWLRFRCRRAAWPGGETAI
jgi:hypothetical protein